MLIALLMTALAVHFTSADYSCLCSYHVEREVYAKPDVSSSVVGYLYEFDCKEVVVGSLPDLGSKWAVIAFEHQNGYVLTDAEITKQICPGSPSAMDSVTTLPTTTSVPKKNTVSLIPSTQSTASIMQSTKPATQSTTNQKDSTTSTTQSTTSTTQRTASTTPSTTATTQSTTSTAESSTAKVKSTTSTTQSTKPTTQSTKPTMKSTTPTSQSTQSTSMTSTMQSTKATSQSTKPTTQSTKPTSQSASTTPTTQSTTPPVKAKTTALHHLLTTHNKQTTTDWTIVPWSTAHSQVHNYRKTTQHAPYHQQTTHSSFHNVNNTVNVGNLNLCPRAVVRLQVPGSRNLRQHGKFCYELRRDAPADWVRASEDCFSYANGFMVQIMSQKDQDFIMQFLREEKVRVPIWIGLTDKGDEEHFYWDSGARLTYTNWDPLRKDNEAPHGQEDCGILKTDGRWDDTICRGYLFSDHHHPWICQYHVRHHGR